MLINPIIISNKSIIFQPPFSENKRKDRYVNKIADPHIDNFSKFIIYY